MPYVERLSEPDPSPLLESPPGNTKFAKSSLSPRGSHQSDSSDDEWPLWSLSDDPHQQFHLETFHQQSLQAINEADESRQQLCNLPAPIRKPGFQRSFSETGTAINDPLAERLRLVARWQSVARRARCLRDPWYRFHLTELPTEECIRHQYSSIRKEWSTDTVQVKLHPEPFDRGAMRECFRLKKLSKFSKSQNWELAMNYVAKRYIQDVDRSVLFEDVKLQMDSKLWAEEYNRHNPPKKIDMFQVTLLEFVNRPGNPLFHLEHFIEGEYIKYNSNSGFVSDLSRQTPQAFSHFTFERSGHRMIVVDIQGVGDLYTDPQVHTADGKGYGDGNLGTKGMALFFHTHICNEICNSLGLTAFDLSPSERANLRELLTSGRLKSTSACRGDEEVCVSLPVNGGESVMETLRIRTISMASQDDRASVGSQFSPLSDVMEHSPTETPLLDLTLTTTEHDENCMCAPCIERELDGRKSPNGSEDSDPLEISPGRIGRKGGTRVSYDDSTTSSICSSRMTQESEKEAFWMEERKKSRPACFISEMELRQLEKLQQEHMQRINSSSESASILGQIHLDMARYHELGRFTKEEGLPYDQTAAWFHLDVAEKCGVLEAILTVAKISLHLPHDLLKDLETEPDEDVGMDMMQTAAEMGDRGAMIFLAEAYESGEHLGTHRTRSWARAAYWYYRAKEIELEEDSTGGEYDGTLDHPRYLILQKLAELHRAGGYGLAKNAHRAGELYNEAAEAAMEAMKGKLANKMYQLAEESFAEIEEEEE